MSCQPARRTRIASPNRATFKKHSPKPILKRPSPLNLANPSLFASRITIVVSPSPAISSSHVHFPASPILTAVFSTHSPNTRSRELGKAMSIYPRSPYPSAPISPSRDKENAKVASVIRAKSLDSPKSRRVVKRPASLSVPAGRPATPRISSPLPSKFLSPVQESPATVTLASTRLSQEFWQSISLETPTAMEAHEGSTPISAVPHLIFATNYGLLWSPGLPTQGTVLGGGDLQPRVQDCVQIR